jgi:predicted membrane-bound dolichyl-phosphate-mannose-protein mannosyltransferase/Gpi18-like mannosyltransferase
MMTRDPARGRGARPSERSLPLEAGALLLAIIVAGLLLRAFIAGIWLPHSGFGTDVGDFTGWAQQLAQVGPGGFYQPGAFQDYPPGYLYVLWALGSIGRALQPLVGVDITGGLIKIPPVLADAANAWLLFLLARRFLGRWAGDRTGERIGLIAAAVYLFNPGVLFDASVWGQVDSVGTLAVLGTIYLLARGWTEAAAVGAVVALLVKFQFGFMIPIVFLVGMKRHAWGRSSDPDHDGAQDLLRVLTSLAAGLGTLVLLIAPFGLSVWAPGTSSASLIVKFVEAASTYHGLTINAFNLWMNPWSGLANPLSSGGLAPSLTWGDDQVVAQVGPVIAMIGSLGITWQLVGIVLFVAVACVAAWIVIRRDDTVGILVCALVVTVAFFVLPTRVHERYLFPALALAAPLVVRGWRWQLLYGLLALSFFVNIYGVYTADWSFVQGSVMNPGVGGQAMARDPVLNATLLSPWGIELVSALIVVVLGWLLVMALDVARRGAELPELQASPAFAAAQPAGASGALDETGTLLKPGAWVGPWPEEPGSAEDGPIGTLRRWLRVDRRHPLYREGWRRLDRVDLLLVVAFVLVAFGYRLWRLGIPTSMHFDEVYHARSATEFLSDWEHGWTRDVYEWTHPMLAKYLIAAGIELANPNQVVSSASLPQATTALTVAPKRSAYGYPRSIAFIGDGTRVTAVDSLSGDQVAQWDTGSPVAVLAFDEADTRLLVGSSSGGQVLVYDLSAFLAHTGPRAPPPGTATIDTGLASVDQILVEPTTLIFHGKDGIGVAERVTGTMLTTQHMAVPQVAFAAGSGDTGSDVILAVEPATKTLVALDASTLAQVRTVSLPAAPLGPIMVSGSGADQQIWIATGPLPATDEHPATQGGMTIVTAPPNLAVDATVPLPGQATGFIWQSVANIVYASGTDAVSGAPTVWTIQPLGDDRSGFATFDSTTLPGPATAMAMDISNHGQADDNGRLLVATLASDGSASLVGIDAGSNAFAWRLMGIFFGSALVGLIYLLAATMFRRRRIAILAAAFVTFDAMSYVMSRIAMNDIYVAFFIVAAYLVFWQIWSGRWGRSAWWALPLVGILIGLAAASKWVGFYALAGLWVMVLARSALGRLLLIALIGFLAIAGGIGAPWPFLAVCLLALALGLVLVVVRPVRLAAADLMAIPATGVVLGGVGLAFAIAWGQVPGRTPRGPVEDFFGFLARGTQAAWPAWIMVGVALALVAWRAYLSLRRRGSDRRWMQPREMGGFAWPWIGACLFVIPMAVYFLCYIPYLQLGHSVAIPNQGPGYGWSLDELQAQMFAYHFGLQAGHPAASPWWSWPLDLKPVWFYGSPAWDNQLVGAIYNGGNPILFWAGIPALLACTVLAWKRRSYALALLVAAFAFQYLPWTWVERATFQYHYFTAVLFAMVAVAYILDEVLRSRAYASLGIAFLVAAVVVGVLIWPLGAAWPMPDWYMNAARALPPWNYEFQFPGPPQGSRASLLSPGSIQLAVGTALGLAAAAFSMWGRDLLDRRRPLGALVGRRSGGGVEEQQAKEDEDQRPELPDAQPREVVPDQEPDPQQDQERPEDEGTSP